MYYFNASNIILVLASAVLLMTTANAQNCSSISELACSSDGFGTLCTLLNITELDLALEEEDLNITVFAPTNLAFDQLGDETLEFLVSQEGLATLEFILLFHVAEGIYNSSDLGCQELLPMLNGEDSRTKCAGNGSGDGYLTFQAGQSNSPPFLPQLVLTDVEACNGILHVVNNVMLP